MAASNQEVLDFVRSALTEQPGTGTRDLYRMASEAYPQVGELTPQQFHGRYFLTAKRALAPKGEAGSTPRTRKKSARTKKAAPHKQGKRAARAAAPSAATEAQAQTGAAPSRDRVRSVFLQFARDFASAESRTDIVTVLSKVDDYVDQVVGHS